MLAASPRSRAAVSDSPSICVSRPRRRLVAVPAPGTVSDRASVRSVATKRPPAFAPHARSGSQSRVRRPMRRAVPSPSGSPRNVDAIARVQAGISSTGTGWTSSGAGMRWMIAAVAAACLLERRAGSFRAIARTTIDQLLRSAQARLARLDPPAAAEAMEAGAALIDIRTEGQIAADGLVPGALVIGRNVLEWRLDPDCEHRDPRAPGLDDWVVLLCDEGYQSSLAAVTLQELGFARATDVIGGFQGWRAAGLPVLAPDSEPTSLSRYRRRREPAAPQRTPASPTRRARTSA